MWLHREDIAEITKILSAFPDAKTFEIRQDNSSGIGSVTTLILDIDVQGYLGKFEVEVAGVEQW